MPLEINEIGIKMSVGDGDDDTPAKKRKQAKKEQAKQGRGACCNFDREELVDDCVRRVLKALHAIQER
jgi:hypothetical protein